MMLSWKRLLLKIGLEKSSVRQTIEVHHLIHDNFIDINADHIMEAVNYFLEMRAQSDDSFYRIFVQTENGYLSLRDSIDKNTIVKRQTDNCIQISVQLRPLNKLSIKKKPIEQVVSKIQKDITKIERSIDDAFPNISQEQLRKFYDLAYFYSEPLVNQKQQQQDIQVTYARQYQNFIKAVQIAPARYIRVKMMVATQDNIKQTLNAGVNILHFASHGDKQEMLRLQDNQCRLWSMSSQILISMLNKVKKPLLIVFNACYSIKIAQKVNEAYPQITTVGYQSTIKNQYCQLFTKQFYSASLAIIKRSMGEIIKEIKEKMKAIDQREGWNQASKFTIFGNTQKILLQSNIQTKHEGVLQYDAFQVLQSEPIGVKKQLYNITKLFHNKKKDFLYFTGPQGIGKSLFWKKCLRYMQSRKIIDNFMEIDLGRKGQYHIKNILGFQLRYLAAIENWIQKKQSERKNNTVILFDHCDDIIKHEKDKFITYLKHHILPLMKLGKIVLITRLIYGQNQKSFEKRITKFTEKEPFKPGFMQFLKFMQIHGSNIVAEFDKIQKDKMLKQKQFQQSLESVCTNPLHIIKGFSQSSTSAQLLEKLKKNVQKNSNQQQSYHQLKKDLMMIQQQASKIVKSYVHSGVFKRTENQFTTFDFFQLQLGKSENPKTLSQIQEFWEQYLYQAMDKILRAVKQIHCQQEESLGDVSRKIGILILRINNISYFLKKEDIIVGNVTNGSFALDSMIQYLKVLNNPRPMHFLVGIKIRILLFLNNIQYIIGRKVKIAGEKLLSQILYRQLKETLNDVLAGPDQIKQIETIVDLQQTISIIQSRHSKFGDKLNEHHFLSNQKLDYHQLLNEIQKYYGQIRFLQTSARTFHLYKDQELRIMEIIGLKLIEMLLTTVSQNKINTDLEIHKERVLKIGDNLIQLKKSKDKSYGNFYKEYMKGYIKTRIVFQQSIADYTKKGISLTFFGEIKQLSRKLKQKPFMEQIEALESSSRSSTIIFMISSPVTYHKQEKLRQINVVRYQSQLLSTLKKVCSKIQSDILIQITDVKPSKIDTQIQQQIQALVSFVYLNSFQRCTFQQHKNYGKKSMKKFVMQQDHQGRSNLVASSQFILPPSLITIISGFNAKELLDNCHRPFISDRNIFIWISYPQTQFNKRQNIRAITQFYDGYLLETICQSIILTFTSAFLKKITSQDNLSINLDRQIITAFQIAKTQALCKASSQFENKCFKIDKVKKIFENIDIGIQRKIQELKKLPIITFKKGSPNIKYFNRFMIKEIKNETYPEMGWNRQLHQLLLKIYDKKSEVIVLQSNDQKVTDKFLQIFMIKLQKFKIFNGEVAYIDFHQKSYDRDDKEEILKTIFKKKNAIQYEEDSKQLSIIDGVNADHLKLVFQLHQQNIVMAMDTKFKQMQILKTKSNSQQNEQRKVVLIATIQTIKECMHEINQFQIHKDYISLDLFYTMRNEKEIANDQCLYLVNQLMHIAKNKEVQMEQLLKNIDLIEQIARKCQTRQQIHEQLHKNENLKKLVPKKKNSKVSSNKSQRH